MNDGVIRVSLDEALDHDDTDWVRLENMTDDELDRAIADDPDTFAMDEPKTDAVFQIFKDAGVWRWRLQSASGETLAHGAGAYRSRIDAQAALRIFRQTVAETRMVA